jgi:hypothetical protein
MGESELSTAEQAGEVLHMRADSVTRKIRLREVPAVKVGRQLWGIHKVLDHLHARNGTHA